MFIIGFAAGAVFMLGVFIAFLVWASKTTPETDSQRMVRVLREAKEEVDAIFAASERQMHEAVDADADLPANWKQFLKEDGQ